MLEKKKVNVMTYDHFWNGKENILNGIIEELKNDLETKEEEERIKLDKSEQPKLKVVLFQVGASIEKKRENQRS